MASAATVLVVDDYLDALHVWDLYLRSVGFNVLTAADGPSALAQVDEHHPDVIVLDLELPGISGFDVARTLRSQPATRHIPLIAATGYSHATQIEAAKACGIDSVVVKPCDPESLVGEIRRLLDVAATDHSSRA
jgi:CheY-like chemotaxis protein